MSTAVSCQEPSFVGGQRYDCPYSIPTSAESVDVSKETVVSFWTAGPLDNTVCLHEPSQHDISYNLGYETEPTWNDHLSPHLQRNKQLQDTLLQREEELARLQEENNKLKEFLNSSVVKCLEAKAKKLLSTPRGTGVRNRKRIHPDNGRSCRFNSSQLLSEAHGKRTCRNLIPDLCSAEEEADTLPLDTWVLQTLGLKDKDTIDPSESYSASINLAANFSSSIETSAKYCSDADHTATYSPNIESAADFSFKIGPSANYKSDSDHTANCSSHINTSPDFRRNISSNISSSVDYIANINPAIPSHDRDSSAPSCQNIDLSANSSSDCTAPLITHLNDVLQLPDSPELHPQMSSLPCEMGTGRLHTSTPDCPEPTQAGPPGQDAPLHTTPCAPRGRTEVAFSMSLEPRSSVRTHSFPQGQAFTCKDTRGGWNFTWVPKDTSYDSGHC
ncbi:hypothetical protein GJAV_G00056260 [Gymnothorax javanicus]|nr:hypothetical protein GJAV_G00056260 [Gymnothorax javanicus]